MLSRVADSIYWMSRYLERCEHLARLLDVTLDLQPERSPLAGQLAFQHLYQSLNLPLPDIELTATTVVQQLLFANDYDGAVVHHIRLARENARQVREQISSEMWEQINRLYLRLQNSSVQEFWLGQPHAFFQQVKEGVQLFHGICAATMNRSESWYFIQLGKYLERAVNIAAILRVHYQQLATHALNPADQHLIMVGLLRSCTAFESYCKVYTADIQPKQIAEFLLLNNVSPYSVRFCVDWAFLGLNRIAEINNTHRNSLVYRRIGRLNAALEFMTIEDVLNNEFTSYLADIQQQAAEIHNIITQNYINYAVSEKLTTTYA